MTWEYLRTAQTADGALGVLRNLLQALSDVEQSLEGDPVLAATRYLRWVERAETELRLVYARGVVARELYTDRYWQIRSIDEQSDSPLGMIRGELLGQHRHILELAQQLERYQNMLRTNANQRLLLCDTNVFIHGMMFDQLSWTRHFKETELCVIFPLVIIDELDRLKDRGETSGRTAGRVLRKIDMLLDQADPFARVKSPTATVSLQLIDEPHGYIRFPGNDDEIVRQAGYFASMNGNGLTLVSRDRGMRIRAAAAGVQARALPREFEKTKDDEE